MHYVCFVYEKREEPDGRVSRPSPDLGSDLEASGRLINSGRLTDPTRLIVRDGRFTIEPGGTERPDPEAPTSLFVIEARDLNDAIRLAERMPKPTIHSVEIRALSANWSATDCV